VLARVPLKRSAWGCVGALLCDRPGPSSMVSPPCSGLGHLQVARVPRKRPVWWVSTTRNDWWLTFAALGRKMAET